MAEKLEALKMLGIQVEGTRRSDEGAIEMNVAALLLWRKDDTIWEKWK